ncbi:N-acetylglucosamine-6-phosphate deacetylase [Deinococcus lacus]|uniref:N-acetylglucosamine-6-phosphate deacetylase n=1 Tax=Deinococcus lacus TaxID=392561 RepID=A0ABW1YEQ0_9DEIO
MPAERTIQGQLLLPQGLVPGALTFSAAGTIQATEIFPAGMPVPPRVVVPGFVDTHVHGGGGGDTMDGPEGVRRLARLHAQHGTTTLLPTTMTAPWEDILAALRGVRTVMEAGGVPGGASVVGAHLEGPFISPQRLGAQPPCTLEPTPQRVAELLEIGVVRAVTLAPEVPQALPAALRFAAAGARVGTGHTVADADTIWALLEAVAPVGRLAATHLFNAMGPVSGRDPGAVGALLAHPQVYPELILDGFHLHPLSAALACAACAGRVMLVTDAMRAAGLGDGASELGGQPVQVVGGRATLAGGTLAGSVLTMDSALRRAVEYGIPLAEASRMASLYPARSLGLHDRGELAVGLRADLVVLESDLSVLEVYVGGQQVPPGDL